MRIGNHDFFFLPLLLSSRISACHRYFTLHRGMGNDSGAGVSCSGAGQYGYTKFSRDTTANSAIRTIDGKRKHLDHLIVDRLKANELTYGVAGDEEDVGGDASGGRPGVEAHEMIDTEEQEVGASHVTETQQTHDEPYDPRDSKWFTPRFVERSIVTHDLAKGVGGPRSPSGAFLSSGNPSIAHPSPISTRPTPAHQLSAFAGAQRR